MMMASDFAAQIQALINKHGDLPVENAYGHEVDPPEYNTDDGPCILIDFSEE